MKHIVWALLFASASCFAGSATNVRLHAQNALVVDVDTNEVLYEKNPHEVKSIASITKLMTAIVILSSKLNMEEEITITQDDVEHTRLHGLPTAHKIPVGMTLSRAELLHFMLMNSQNIAAAALARTYPGGYNVFIQTMNAEADVLGMIRTNFVDSCGLNEGNVSDAHDLAILVKTAAEYPMIADFSTSPRFEATGYYKNKSRTLTMGTTNRLLTMKNWDIVLQKTGFTNIAGHCMVLLTNIGPRKVAMVVLDSVSNNARTADANILRAVANNEMVPSSIKLTKKQKKHIKAARKKKKRVHIRIV